MKVPVVIVDDDETDRYIAKRVLTGSGFASRVVEYTNGASFLEIISDEERRRTEVAATPPPILVLLDINMPGVDGFEVLAAIKRDLHDRGLDPDYMIVLMFSSSNHAEDKASAFSYDFVADYIVKPITPEQVENIYTKFYASEG